MPKKKSDLASMTEAQKKAAGLTISRYCEERVPAHVRDKVRLVCRWRGAAATIFEERPYFRDDSRWTASAVAQFRYNAAAGLWTLYCRDSKGRWHLYTEVKPARSVQPLLQEVDKDPTGIFWG